MPHLKAHVLVSDISAPALWMWQIINILTMDITSIYSACIDEFSAIRIESFIVNFSLELVKFDISTCAFKWGIMNWNYSSRNRKCVTFIQIKIEKKNISDILKRHDAITDDLWYFIEKCRLKWNEGESLFQSKDFKGKIWVCCWSFQVCRQSPVKFYCRDFMTI